MEYSPDNKGFYPFQTDFASIGVPALMLLMAFSIWFISLSLAGNIVIPNDLPKILASKQK